MSAARRRCGLRQGISSLLRAAACEIRLLREFLPAAVPDLSAQAVSRWPAHVGPACPRCGAFTGPRPTDTESAICMSCLFAPPAFDAARSLFPYAGDVRAAIVASKYGGRPYPSRAVAQRIREALAGRWKDLFPDGSSPAVVPVPAHPWKYLRRGFNLPSLIGSNLARATGYRFRPLVLSRIRERIPQAALASPDRERNVAGAFRLLRGTRSPARVLLLDDVYTTGATARAAARALKTGGADHIVVVTVARTVS